MKRLILALTVCCGLALLATPAMAKHRHRSRHHGHVNRHTLKHRGYAKAHFRPTVTFGNFHYRPKGYVHGHYPRFYGHYLHHPRSRVHYHGPVVSFGLGY